MKYLLLRDEKSIADIVDKVYGRLSADEQKIAETAILKNNTRLKSISKMRKGTLITIPSIAEIPKHKKRSVVNINEEKIDFINKNITSLEKTISQKFEHYDRTLQTSNKQIKEVIKKVKGHKISEETATKLKQHITKSKKIALEKNQSAQTILKRIKDTTALLKV